MKKHFLHFCLIVLSVVAGTAANAQAKVQVAIDVIGTIARGVPIRTAAATIEAERLVIIDNKAFVIYPGVVELLKNLQNDSAFEVSFRTDANAFSVKVVKGVLEKAGWAGEPKLIERIPLEWKPDSAIYFTHESGLDVSQATVIAPVKSYFYYPSFVTSEVAKKAVADVPAQFAFFPPDEQTWLLSYHRFEYFYLTLLMLKNGEVTLKSFEDKVVSFSTRDGDIKGFLSEWSRGGYRSESAGKLISKDARITGCESKVFDPNKRTITKTTLGADRLADCVKHYGKPKLAWLDKAKTKCASFYSDLFYREESQASCSQVRTVATEQDGGYQFSVAVDVFSVRNANRAPQVIGGVSLPRWGAPLWRGVSPCGFHFKPADFLAAFLGLKYYFMPSKKMSALLSQLKSVDAVMDVHKDMFEAVNGPGLFLPANWPDDGMYLTIHYEIAKIYSGKGFGCPSGAGIVFAAHDYSRRGLDATYASQKKGERDINVDAGEYFMPMLVDDSEIDGMIFPESKQAFYRVTENGRNFVLVYQNTECSFKDQSDQVQKCRTLPQPSNPAGNDYLVNAAPAKSMGAATASAVLMVCEAEKPCDLPDGFAQRHKVSFAGSPFKLAIDLKTVPSDGKELKAAFAP